MYRLVATKRFQKQLKRFLIKHPDVELSLIEFLGILQKNPSDSKLKAHKLSGKLKSLSAASITYEYRIIFCIKEENIYLLALGTHDEVY